MTRKTKRTTKRPAAPPLGLRILFSSVREASATRTAPALHAARALPIAREIVRTVHAEIDGSISDQLVDAVSTFYGDGLLQEFREEPSHVAEAAFYVGMTTAWLLLQSMQGAEVTQ